MNARQFDSQATKGVAGYLERHGLKSTEFRIQALKFARSGERFEFLHHNVIVHTCFGRKAALDWMKNSQPIQMTIAEAP